MPERFITTAINSKKHSYYNWFNDNDVCAEFLCEIIDIYFDGPIRILEDYLKSLDECIAFDKSVLPFYDSCYLTDDNFKEMVEKDEKYMVKSRRCRNKINLAAYEYEQAFKRIKDRIAKIKEEELSELHEELLDSKADFDTLKLNILVGEQSGNDNEAE